MIRGIGRPGPGGTPTPPALARRIATFAAALGKGIEHHGASVILVEAGNTVPSGSAAVAALGTADRDDIEAVADVLNDCHATIVQHEYGIYPGTDGSSIVDVVRALTNPVIVNRICWR